MNQKLKPKGHPEKGVIFYQYDDIITFTPAVPKLLATLTIWIKELVLVKWKQQVQRTQKQLFTIEKQKDGTDLVITSHGYLSNLMLDCFKSNIPFEHHDLRLCREKKGFPAPRLDAMYGFRFSQKELLTSALIQDCSGMIGAPTRYGKCHTKGTKVLMHDFSTKSVENVRVGDKLMGPDMHPRTVKALGTGVEKSYMVKPEYGEPFGCNESHILSLRMKRDSLAGKYKELQIVNMSIKDYINSPSEFKRIAGLWYAAWSGEQDGEIAHSISRELYLELCESIRKKTIQRLPQELLSADYFSRWSIAAALCEMSYVVDNVTIDKDKKELTDDIIQLFRSLGKTIVRTYTRYGDIRLVFRSSEYFTYPHALTSFELEDIGEQDYYGFEIEGNDSLYLLWDYCVTHNTTLMINTLRAFPTLRTVVTCPGVDLVTQLAKDIKNACPSRDVTLLCTGSKARTEGDDITVCSADSLSKCNPEKIKLLLVDEPHAMVTESRFGQVQKFACRRYFFGATLKGRFDNKDFMIKGLGGDILANRTYKDAVAEGAVCPLNIIFLKMVIPPDKNYGERNRAYNTLLFQNEAVCRIVKRICEEIIPKQWQTLIFIKHEKQAEMLLSYIGDEHTIAMAKKMSKAQRKEITDKMQSGEILRCLASNIYAQGVTFSDVKVLINCEAGGNNTSAIQKPGRLAEIRPGKKCGVVIDFNFVSACNENASVGREQGEWTSLCSDSRARREAYKEIGYGIHDADTIEELHEKFITLTN